MTGWFSRRVDNAARFSLAMFPGRSGGAAHSRMTPYALAVCLFAGAAVATIPTSARAQQAPTVDGMVLAPPSAPLAKRIEPLLPAKRATPPAEPAPPPAPTAAAAPPPAPTLADAPAAPKASSPEPPPQQPAPTAAAPAPTTASPAPPSAAVPTAPVTAAPTPPATASSIVTSSPAPLPVPTPAAKASDVTTAPAHRVPRADRNRVQTVGNSPTDAPKRASARAQAAAPSNAVPRTRTLICGPSTTYSVKQDACVPRR